jgi:hypothetical protein
MDASGNTAWTMALADLNSANGLDASGLARVGQDGVVISGNLRGAFDFGGGVLDTHGERPSVVLRVGPDGVLRWSRIIRGLNSMNYLAGLAATTGGFHRRGRRHYLRDTSS